MRGEYLRLEPQDESDNSESSHVRLPNRDFNPYLELADDLYRKQESVGNGAIPTNPTMVGLPRPKQPSSNRNQSTTARFSQSRCGVDCCTPEDSNSESVEAYSILAGRKQPRESNTARG